MLHRLSMVNFRNYEALSLSFFKGINVFFGSNGVGKTNLLEAVYFLCRLESFRSIEVVDALRFDADECYLSGKIGGEKKGVKTLEFRYGKSLKKKKVFLDGENFPIQSYLNLQTCLFMSNEDIITATGSMTYRRNTFNAMISMMSNEYRISLLKYQQLLKKRGELLKNRKISEDLDERLSMMGLKIMRARRNIVSILEGRFNEIYVKLFDGTAKASIALEKILPDLEANHYLKEMEKNRELDLRTKRTDFGPHKEEIYFYLGGKDLRKVGSQAQTKLYIYALKLAIYDYMREKLSSPILLMDDVFADLDPSRIKNLLLFIDGAEQVFLTCANEALVTPYVKGAHFYEITQNKGIVHHEK